jgi:hypothetical protein
MAACFFLVLGMLATTHVAAQANAYPFSSTTGNSLVTIPSPTVLTTVNTGSVDDGTNLISPAGFTFPFNGTNYTEFRQVTNGWVRMGNATPSSTIPSSLTSIASNEAVYAFGRDGNLNVANGGNMTHGATADGKYVFQFTKMAGGSGGGTSATIFVTSQIVLWGTTSATPGRIEIIYSTSAGTPATGGTIGISDSAGRYTNATNGGSTTVLGTSSAWPASGIMYAFDPPTPCAGTPVAGTASPSTLNFCSGTAPSAVSIAGFTGGVSGITFQWEESDDNGVSDAWANAVGGSGATTSSYTPPVLTGTRYYRVKVSCTGSGLFAYSNTVVAQLANCEYNVTRTPGNTYSSIAATGTGLTFTGTSIDDQSSTATNIGFNFFYKGTTYSQFVANTNGFIALGASTSSSFTNNLGSGTNIIAPLWDDLFVTGLAAGQGTQNGTFIKYKLDGTSPNQILTVEWIGMEQFNYPGPNLNFQVKLYEGSNKIELIHGSMEPFNGTTSTSTTTSINKWSYSLGLAGPSGATGANRTLAQLGENTAAFGTPDPTNLAVAPECNVKYTFDTGAYTGPTSFSYTAPANDNTAGAFALPVNASPCINLCGTYYTTGSATASPEASSCAAAPDDDVWFSFVAPTSGQVLVSVKGATGFDAVVSVTNSLFAEITGGACVNATVGSASNTNFGQTESLNLTGLTGGATYYVRVSHNGAGFGSRSGFSICINDSLIPPPANDNPCGAVALTPTTGCTPYSDTASNSTTNVINASTTTTNGVVAPTCAGAGATVNDVWFKFTATSTTHGITATPVAGFDIALEGYTIASGTCGTLDLALTSVSCLNTSGSGVAETTALTTVIGQEYYIRAYRHPSGFAGVPVSNSQFSICITTPVPACTTNSSPANPRDRCQPDADPLPGQRRRMRPTTIFILVRHQDQVHFLPMLQERPLIRLQQAQTLLGTTQYFWYVVPKNANGAAVCGVANETSFTTQKSCFIPTALTVATPDAVSADVSWTGPTGGDSVIGYEYAVTTSATPPASGTSTASTTASVSGLTGGTTYYLHVRSECVAGVSFSDWATIQFKYIAGDNCSSAISLATLTSPYNGDTTGAANDFTNTCAGGNTSPDLVYYIDVQAGYTLTIGQTANDYDSENTAFYGGACPGGTQIACYDDPDVQNVVWQNTTATTQRVYWVQDGFSGSTNFGTFTLAWSLAPPPIVITSFTPAMICSSDLGTAVVTLTGSNFTGATNVTLNGTSTPFTVVNDTTITVNLTAGSTEGTFVVYNAATSGTNPTALDVVLSPSVSAITNGDATLCAGETVDLDNLTPAGTWASLNASVATVDSDGIVTAVAAGATTVTYSVTSEGCTTTVSTTITVNDPIISNNPIAQTVVTGNNASYSVTASGSIDSYQWQVSTDGGTVFADISDDAIYGGSTTNTLTITNTPSAYNGYYYQVVITAASPCAPFVSSPAILNVGDTGIATDPSNVTLCSTGTGLAVYTVVASGTVSSYAWEEDQGLGFAPITDGTFGGITYSGSTTDQLTVSGVGLANSGWQYHAIVTGPANGATSNVASLTVNEGVTITTNPSNQTVCYAGGSSLFNVATTGLVSGYQWQYSTDGVTFNNVVNGTPVGATYTGATTSQLTVATTGATH